MSVHWENKNKHKVKESAKKKYLEYLLEKRVLSYWKRNNLQINKKMNDSIRNEENINWQNIQISKVLNITNNERS